MPRTAAGSRAKHEIFTRFDDNLTSASKSPSLRPLFLASGPLSEVNRFLREVFTLYTSYMMGQCNDLMGKGRDRRVSALQG